ncbi:MAG TPA: hypothetical protein VLG67_02160 [Candidatus Saccharimonadales bacterium]|nr:hypothetical protein [Candidatus Saccharimonadales bacterium]
MHHEKLRTVTVEKEPSFPPPMRDRLGLAKDPIYLSSRQTQEGQEFVLVHSRPFLGEAMHTFLNTVAPYRKTHWNRRHAAGNFTPAEDEHHLIHEPGREASDREEAMHRRVGKYGIGTEYIKFGKEVRRDWAKAFEDPETDTVFTPLSSLIAIADFKAFRDWQISQWLPDTPDYEGSSRSRPRWVADMINGIYSSRHLYATYDQNIRNFIASLDEAERDNLVGRALSGFEKPGFSHWHAHNLVLDLAGQRHWYSPLYKYGGFHVGLTDELEYPIPTIEFDGSNFVTISNDENVYVKLRFGEPEDATSQSPWTIESYKLPESYYELGRFAAVAWRINQDGQREFFDQQATVEAARNADIPILGVPDSYLGKILLRYFRQPGEYEESPAERKWLKEVGLPGSPIKRPITQRELPVWMQKEEHQQDLLNSQFLQAAEQLAA